MMESVVGAGGVLVMPPGYMQGIGLSVFQVRILMHMDEVMVGFGRSWKLFGFQHYDGVLPDIVTCARGISVLLSALHVIPVRKRSCVVLR
jgi:taurine--2-oxoglutarate transaminase